MLQRSEYLCEFSRDMLCGKRDSYFLTMAANINSITAETAETAENEISCYTTVINSPEEFNKLFEHTNVSFEEILKVLKLVNLTNRHGKKSNIITS